MRDIDNIGGWPKIISEEPSRPHENLEAVDDLYDPHKINAGQERYFDETNNVFFPVTVFMKFHRLRLYPPEWVLQALADRFYSSLTIPEPDIFATEFGVRGVGSGATNPYDEFKRIQEREKVFEDMIVLMSVFDITFISAARAVIEKYNLSIIAKTVTNRFREKHGGPNLFLKKNRNDDKLQDSFFVDTVQNRKTYLSSFPPSALKFINSK